MGEGGSAWEPAPLGRLPRGGLRRPRALAVSTAGQRSPPHSCVRRVPVAVSGAFSRPSRVAPTLLWGPGFEVAVVTRGARHVGDSDSFFLLQLLSPGEGGRTVLRKVTG